MTTFTIPGPPVKRGCERRVKSLVPHIVDSETGCWEWQRAKTGGGYGFLWNGNRSQGAHRWYWEQVYGPIPEGMLALHHCDNPACVNPDHLFLGTAADNAADMVAKKRQCFGERNAGAKLTAEQAIAVRTYPAPSRATARMFGISPTQVKRIRRGECWHDNV